jgi:hypothetical protein
MVNQINKILRLSESLKSEKEPPYFAVPIVRFAKKIEVDALSGCWHWVGALNSGGYGSFDGTSSHRFIYEYLYDGIPKDLHIDHLCRNKRCCNPVHLEAVTRLENNRRAAAMITNCPRGHAYDAENTDFDKNGWRHCLECRRNRRNYWKERSDKYGLRN